ncbi:MAG: TldD/PmbA family protein [Deltaproteobacteria bacterium]|nr:TldD/PmbA family protein [Deltaproteobacteria bacterium]
MGETIGGREPLEAWLERAVRLLSAAPVQAWEICATEEYSASAETMDRRLLAVESLRDRGIGIRVLADGLGFSSLVEGSEAALARAVEAAQAEARLVRGAAITSFAESLDGPQVLEVLSDPRATGRPREALGALALELEARARRADPRVVATRPSQISEVVGRVLIRTSSGLSVEERYSRAFATVGAVAEADGDSHLVMASGSASCLEALVLDPLATRAASRAARRLGAGAFRTGRAPVLLDPEVVADLVEVLLAALAGDGIDRGASFLAPKLGTRVLSPALTLLDRPRDPDLDGAAFFDGEGLPTVDRALIEGGVVRGLLDDRETAARSRRAAQGSAVRASALGRPGPGAHGPHLRPGLEALGDLLVAAEGGLYVSELSGTHTINEITGDLSLGASGWVVEGGRWGRPVEGVTVAGNLLELLGDRIRLSAETEVHRGMRVPAVFLEAVQVASAG